MHALTLGRNPTTTGGGISLFAPQFGGSLPLTTTFTSVVDHMRVVCDSAGAADSQSATWHSSSSNDEAPDATERKSAEPSHFETGFFRQLRQVGEKTQGRLILVETAGAQLHFLELHFLPLAKAHPATEARSPTEPATNHAGGPRERCTRSDGPGPMRTCSSEARRHGNGEDGEDAAGPLRCWGAGRGSRWAERWTRGPTHRRLVLAGGSDG